MRWAGMRTATVPRVSPRSHDSDGCDGQDDGEPARPELLDEALDRLGHLGDERAQRREPGDEHGRRRLAAAALRIEQALRRRWRSKASAATP